MWYICYNYHILHSFLLSIFPPTYSVFGFIEGLCELICITDDDSASPHIEHGSYSQVTLMIVVNMDSTSLINAVMLINTCFTIEEMTCMYAYSMTCIFMCYVCAYENL